MGQGYRWFKIESIFLNNIDPIDSRNYRHSVDGEINDLPGRTKMKFTSYLTDDEMQELDNLLERIAVRVQDNIRRTLSSGEK